MNRIKLIAAFLLVASFSFAQTAPPTDIASIQQNFKKLDVLGSVLYVAAHPAAVKASCASIAEDV